MQLNLSSLFRGNQERAEIPEKRPVGRLKSKAKVEGHEVEQRPVGRPKKQWPKDEQRELLDQL